MGNVLDGVVAFFILDIAAFLVVATTGGGAYGDWLLSLTRTGEGLALMGAAKAVLPLGWLGSEFFRARKKLAVSARELAELLSLPHLATHSGWSTPFTQPSRHWSPTRDLAHADDALTDVDQVLKPAPDRVRVTT